ncbi:hypothetical protein LWI28_011880 [Acer negundo]|uniref:Plastocyanin-like domain-containing protein n=1 Tax=Acer negundo TaxID=4023 RepID=A0AAD5I6C2_ACENE|nr:hypothetical protein LWI28_011880 [Acer negundo]
MAMDNMSAFLIVCFVGFLAFPAEAAVKNYQLDIQVTNVSRLCHAKPIVTVNGMFPGPTIYAGEGDRVIYSLDSILLHEESHLFHLHGYNFFVVGSGICNFDPKKDPAKLNLVDPPERNAVGVPKGGWTAIRFRADNPGVWFMRCHMELHTMWGLNMAFVVENGKLTEESVLPQPKDLPPC